MQTTEPDHQPTSVSPGSWILAIDTSAVRAGVALWNGEEMHEVSWPVMRRQTTDVLPRIETLMQDAGVAVSDLGGVAVAMGPGTFTGLRVGMSLAKGFAMSAGIPIAGVPTLGATALPWIRAGQPVVAVLPAGRGRLVWQQFGSDNPASDPVNGTPEELLAWVQGQDLIAIVGELPATLRARLAEVTVPVLGEPGYGSRVGAVALIGRKRLMTGDADDLSGLEPVYVHGTSPVTRPVRDARP